MKQLLIVALCVLLSACSSYGVSEDGYPLWGGYEVSAAATPLGPIYFNHSEEDPDIRKHEWCHIGRMKEMGTALYLTRYVLDHKWACSEERACGWDGPHPRCWNDN